HSIFFTKIGHAIHGSYEIKRLGAPASHGCVRLAPENAAKLFALVKEEGVLNTTVVLTGAIPAGGAPAVARRSPAGAPLTIRPAPNQTLYADVPPDTADQQPQYRQPQYGQPQYGQPQYGQPQYGQPQYQQPQYGQPQYARDPNYPAF